MVLRTLAQKSTEEIGWGPSDPWEDNPFTPQVSPDTDEDSTDPLLREFSTLEKELEFWKTQNGFEDWEQEQRVLRRLEKSRYLANKALGELAKHLQPHSTFFRELIDYWWIENLATENGREEIEKKEQVVFSGADILPPEVLAAFSPLGSRIYGQIDRIPTPYQTLRELCRTGKLPDNLAAMLHELTHAQQARNRLRASFWNPPQRTLMEAQAYASTNTETFNYNHVIEALAREQPIILLLAGRFQKIRDLLKATGHTAKMKRRAKAAYKVIEEMHALGIHAQGITRICQKHPKYEDHETEGCFPEIDEFIDEQLDIKGLTRTELNRLVLEQRIRRQVETEKVRYIVQRFLRRFDPNIRISREDDIGNSNPGESEVVNLDW